MDILNKLQKLKEEAWNKMGDTGAKDYWEKATEDEIWWFGRFSILEDLEDLITYSKREK